MKKILFVLGTLLLIALVILAFWFLFFRNTTPENPEIIDNTDTFGTFFNSEDGSVGSFFGPGKDVELAPEDYVENTQIPILRQLSVNPIAGYTFYKKEFDVLEQDLNATNEDKEKEERYAFRFMERGAGHIFETEEKSMAIKKVSNTTNQKIISSQMSKDGQFVLFEKLSGSAENIESFFGELFPPEEIEGETITDPVFNLETEAYSILSSFFTTSPNKQNFAYITEAGPSSSVFIDNFKKNERKEIFNSPIKEWLLDWPSENKILLITKPSATENGFAYLLDTKTGILNKILGNIKGLTVKVNSSADNVLYSETERSTVILRTKNLGTGETKRVALSTLPEKCVFSSVEKNIIYCGAPNYSISAKYPDDWYKGLFFFEDSIWKINSETGLVDSVYHFDKNKYGRFDIEEMTITDEDEFLVFKNKRDLTLWSLNINALKNDSFIPDSAEDF